MQDDSRMEGQRRNATKQQQNRYTIFKLLFIAFAVGLLVALSKVAPLLHLEFNQLLMVIVVGILALSIVLAPFMPAKPRARPNQNPRLTMIQSPIIEEMWEAKAKLDTRLRSWREIRDVNAPRKYMNDPAKLQSVIQRCEMGIQRDRDKVEKLISQYKILQGIALETLDRGGSRDAAARAIANKAASIGYVRQRKLRSTQIHEVPLFHVSALCGVVAVLSFLLLPGEQGCLVLLGLLVMLQAISTIVPPPWFSSPFLLYGLSLMTMFLTIYGVQALGVKAGVETNQIVLIFVTFVVLFEICYILVPMFARSPIAVYFITVSCLFVLANFIALLAIKLQVEVNLLVLLLALFALLGSFLNTFVPVITKSVSSAMPLYLLAVIVFFGFLFGMQTMSQHVTELQTNQIILVAIASVVFVSLLTTFIPYVCIKKSFLTKASEGDPC